MRLTRGAYSVRFLGWANRRNMISSSTLGGLALAASPIDGIGRAVAKALGGWRGLVGVYVLGPPGTSLCSGFICMDELLESFLLFSFFVVVW